VSEDFDKKAPEADVQQQDKGDEDVEAHKFGPAEDKVHGATEEGPDVEAHRFAPKVKE
jgi:hypothetical protein